MLTTISSFFPFIFNRQLGTVQSAKRSFLSTFLPIFANNIHPSRCWLVMIIREGGVNRLNHKSHRYVKQAWYVLECHHFSTELFGWICMRGKSPPSSQSSPYSQSPPSSQSGTEWEREYVMSLIISFNRIIRIIISWCNHHACFVILKLFDLTLRLETILRNSLRTEFLRDFFISLSQLVPDLYFGYYSLKE